MIFRSAIQRCLCAECRVTQGFECSSSVLLPGDVDIADTMPLFGNLIDCLTRNQILSIFGFALRSHLAKFPYFPLSAQSLNLVKR